jgi:transketolase
MRSAYLSALYDLAGENKNILALISDNGAIVYDKFRKDRASQYYNYGISEANMIASAAGLASCGKIPFAYTISNFLIMRAFEFIRNDVCMQNQNVKLVGTGAGFIYSTLGPTHHATEDLAIMRVLPNLTIFSPASPIEVRNVTYAAAEIKGPVYMRLGTNREPEIYKEEYNFTAGKGVEIKTGKDITIIGTGSILYDIIEASESLYKKGIRCKVINIHSIKPMDSEIIIGAAKETGIILTVEEHSITGGLGSVVAEIIAENNISNIIFKRMGLSNTFSKGCGTHSEMKELNGISKEQIVKSVLSLLKKAGERAGIY